jgi:hypothetical protein
LVIERPYFWGKFGWFFGVTTPEMACEAHLLGVDWCIDDLVGIRDEPCKDLSDQS